MNKTAKIATVIGRIGEGNAMLKILFIVMPILCSNHNVDAKRVACLSENNSQLLYIDEITHICCNGKYEKVDKHGFVQDCCEKNDGKLEVFSTRNKICCGGELIDLHTPRNSTLPVPECCGHDYFYPKNQSCCNNKTYSKLTHAHYDPYNERIEVDCCEGGVSHLAPEMNVTCCGNELIDLNINDCCNNTKIEYPMLCCGGKQIYSRKSGLECCGSQLINNSYICCKLQSQMFVPVRKERGDNMCCGRRTYKSYSNKICCAGQIIDVEQNETCTSEASNKNYYKKLKKMLQSETNTKRYRNGPSEHCLSCKTFFSPPKNSGKKFEYQLYIRDITIKWKRTTIDVLFLEPYDLRKAKLKLSTKGRCRCFRKDELYMLQSNQNMLDKVKCGRNRLRFSGRDMFRIIKEAIPKDGVKGQKCKIN